MFKKNKASAKIATNRYLSLRSSFWLKETEKKRVAQIGPIGLVSAPSITVRSNAIIDHFRNKPKQHNENKSRCNESVKSATDHRSTVVLDVITNKYKNKINLSHCDFPKNWITTPKEMKAKDGITNMPMFPNK